MSINNTGEGGMYTPSLTICNIFIYLPSTKWLLAPSMVIVDLTRSALDDLCGVICALAEAEVGISSSEASSVVGAEVWSGLRRGDELVGILV